MNVWLQVLAQPFLVILSVNVYVPEVPARTLTVAPVVDPCIMPLPVILQEWTTVPPAGKTVDV